MQLLKDLKSGNYKTTYLNTLSCNGRVGFIYADGAINNFLEEFYKNKSGHIGAQSLTKTNNVFNTRY